MLEQRQEMKEIGDVADGVLGHVENLSADFKKIDAAQQKAEKRWTDLVSDFNVKSAPEHVQGTTSDVREPVGYVQPVPNPVNEVTGDGRKEKEVESM